MTKPALARPVTALGSPGIAAVLWIAWAFTACVPVPGGGGNGGGNGGGTGVCAGPLRNAGTSDRAIEWGGQERTYVLHVPENLDPTRRVPIVFVFHGFTMSGQIMVDLTHFTDVADREGFVVVFPDGEGTNPWNVGENACAGGPNDPNTDDIGFFEAMLEDIADENCLARDQVFSTGFSMGGYLTHHIACQDGELLRGAAPHSGGTYSGDCPGAPVPMMIVHGDEDWLVPPACGTDAREYWVSRNGCSNDVTTVPIRGGRCEYSQGCDAPVVLCVLEGMSHGWSGAPQTGLLGIYAGGDEYEDATELIWRFFEDQL